MNHLSLDHFIPSYIRLWNQDTPCSKLPYRPSYHFIRQFTKYFQVKKQLQKIFAFVESNPSDALNTLKESPDVAKLVSLFTDMNLSHIDSSMQEEFITITKEFMVRAQKRFPDMSNESLHQALRNVWIMNMLQLIFGFKIQLTDPIFAYSMLYPLTDNLIDEVSLKPEEKQAFIETLEKRLHGETVNAHNKTEQDIFDMIHFIEQSYPRSDFTQVYESLLLIHESQKNSLRQQYDRNLSFSDILELTFRKGAASVIADGCLIAGHISDAQLCFLTGYGIILQLCDDIQDLILDKVAGRRTIFGISSQKERKLLTCKLLLLAYQVVEQIHAKDFNAISNLKKAIYPSIFHLVSDAVYENRQHYPPSFLRYLSRTTPLGLNRRYEKTKKYLLHKIQLLQTENLLNQNSAV